jgi:hypothetical protein
LQETESYLPWVSSKVEEKTDSGLLNDQRNQLLELGALLEGVQEFLSHVGFTVLGLAKDDEVLEGLSDITQFTIDVWFGDGKHQTYKNLAIVFHESLLYLCILSMELNDHRVQEVAEKLHQGFVEFIIVNILKCTLEIDQSLIIESIRNTITQVDLFTRIDHSCILSYQINIDVLKVATALLVYLEDDCAHHVRLLLADLLVLI